MKAKLLLLIILVFYIWTASAGKLTFEYKDYDGSHSHYYNLLSDAFFLKQLHLPVEPRPELLALADPYDPASNGPYRLHDCSLYKEKYFLYFGVTPAIVLYMPYRLFSGAKLPDNLAVLIFMFGSLLWSVLLLSHLRAKYFKQVPEWMMLVAIGVLGVCNFGPFILQRTEVYEVAISCGIFFLTGSIYWLCSCQRDKKLQLFKLALGSLFLGLAIGGRPHIILTAVILPLIYFGVVKNKLDLTTKDKIRTALALAIPFVLCIFALGIYNYLRFDNFFEFGNNYQTGVANLKSIKYHSFENIASGIYFFLFRNPIIDSNFPFIHAEGVPIPPDMFVPGVYFFELMVGLLPGIPFLMLLVISPIIYWLQMNFSCKTLCPKNKILLDSFMWIVFLTIGVSFLIFFINTFADGPGANSLITFFESIISAIFTIPGILFVLSIQIVLWLCKMHLSCNESCHMGVSFPTIEFAAILLAACLNLGIHLAMPFVTMRYLADFSILFILAACVIWFYFDSNLLPGMKWKSLLMVIAILLASYSIFASFAYSIRGIYGGLEATNPESYYSIQKWFSPLIRDRIK